MSVSQLDKILDKIPYSDGTARRRIVSGGLILIGILIIYHDFYAKNIDAKGSVEILTSPIFIFAALLTVYAIGMLVEMLGEIFLVRAASGIFWALSWPRNYFQRNKNHCPKAKLYIITIIKSIVVVPILAITGIIWGLIGKTKYKLAPDFYLSDEARLLFSKFPLKVQEGLTRPVGDDAETAHRHIIDMFRSESERKWAKNSFSKCKDVSTITTALLILSLFFITNSFVNELKNPRISPDTHIEKLEKDIYEAIKTIEITDDKLDKSKLIQLIKDAKDMIASSSELNGELSSRLRTKVSLFSTYVKDKDKILPNEDIPDFFKVVAKVVKDPNDDHAYAKQCAENLKKLEVKFANYKNENEKYQKDSLIRVALYIMFVISLLLLYIGYFVTLRNSTISILDTLAIKIE